ncbi:MAG: hypothetical protein QOK48_2337 [Blastocatellia bacterium]|jgi:hypothetical protein|nr:hypothetical protein [Blastocatellia bacterium]
MKAGMSRLRALAILLALAGVFATALSGNVRTGGFVVRADNCFTQGNATYVNNVLTCDCVILGGHNCGCIAPCPPLGD